ncbi:MAG: cytochrome P450, partial [Acidimicrobiales bacterium]
MATIVHELDLPEIDNMDLTRHEALVALEAARDQHWLARTPLGYIVMHHADVTAVLGDRRFHSALSLLPQMSGVEDAALSDRQQRSILAMEGDEHQRLRRLVAPAFTPRSADRLRPVMRRVIGGLVEPLLPSGRCELVADVCEPYPIPIICELLGAPAEDWKLFSAWATDIFRIFNNDMANDLERIKAAMSELDAYVRAMIDERRSQPADDLLSDLIAAEEAGDRLSPDELVMMCEAVLMAGTDTTRNQLACSVALLAQRPDQWRRLAQDPELAKSAVEETMRHLGAVGGTARFASEEIEYRDVIFPVGTLVAVSLATANMDGTIWEDPHR